VATQNQDKSINIDNMGPGINTSADDFGICLKTPLEGFISSNRSGGKGDDDIWVIRNSKNDLKIVKFVLLGETYEKTEGGKLLELKGAKVRLIDDQMNTLGEVTTNDSAVFTFNLEANRNYTLLAEYPNHYAKRENFTTFGKQPPQEQLTEKETIITLEQDLILDPLKKGESFVLDNIYFDYDKADIKDSAALELDKVVTILTDNPTIEIEMSSHTDSRGAKDYNQKLSQRRAESTVQYLVSKGIAVKRLTAKGYGFEKPVILEAVTEEDHQRNRRTEFKVIKINKQ
jgi:outer membrane protein OmpA-like peptidoglycan-associated protein